MTTERDTTRVVRSWLRVDDGGPADHLLEAVLVRIDTTPQRPATWWSARRPSTMNTTLKFGLAAVVAAVAILIGINYFGRSSNVGGPDFSNSPAPTPSATAVPTASPTATPIPTATPDGLPTGSSHDLWNAPPIGTMTVTIPADGWTADLQGGILIKNNSGADPPDGAGMIVFGEDVDWLVPSNPCAWESSLPDTPATTVDELIAAFAGQDSRDPSEPVDITLDGRVGKSITLHVPDDAVFGTCARGQYCSFARESVSREGGCQRFHQGPGQIDKLWIVDVDGVPMIIDAAWYDETPPDHVAEIEAIVNSVTFGD